ncbi:MAG: squalene/phytoene synthase family protein [Sphingomonadales bacterium]|jgi:phytoene synthase
MSSGASKAESAQSCAEILRGFDYDRYLALLYAPADQRDALMAISAFNAELARIPGLASEPMVGEIRLAWWREALADLFAGKIRPHPILQALGKLDALPHDLMEDMVEARIDELYREEALNIKELRDYARRTHGALNRLLLKQLDVASDDRADEAAMALTLTGTLKAMSYHAHMRGNVNSGERIFQGEFTDETLKLAQDLAEAALTHIENVKQNKPPKRALPVFLPLVSAQDHLKRITAVGYDPRRIDLQKHSLKKQIKLFWAALRGRI